MLRRTPFRPKVSAPAPRPDRSSEFASYTAPKTRAVMVSGLRAGVRRVLPKDRPARCEAYRRLVAALPCIQCRIDGLSQAAHPNAGKGMALKATDTLCFPLCGPRLGVPGCHAMFDQGAAFTKAERRQIEQEWAIATQKEIMRRGLWPKGLPKP